MGCKCDLLVGKVKGIFQLIHPKPERWKESCILTLFQVFKNLKTHSWSTLFGVFHNLSTFKVLFIFQIPLKHFKVFNFL